MKTFYSLDDFLKSEGRLKKFILTLGVFDGVHSAHQKIIKSMVKKAEKKRLSTLVITFHPHPKNMLNKAVKAPLLISLKHRLRLLGELGVEYAIVLGFTERLSRMSAADFIKTVLARIGIDEIIVGKNFFFGRHKKGNIADLRKFSASYGYRVNAVPDLKNSGEPISSTRIRSLILKGDLKKASLLLDRPVGILGTVINGHKRGRIIGFPTANINPHHEAIPPSGVYAVKVRLNKGERRGDRGIDKGVYTGILNIGVKPTFKKSPLDKDPTIEVHIFDFNKSIYGKDLEIMFVKKIRNERKFRGVAALRRQIKEDAKVAPGFTK